MDEGKAETSKQEEADDFSAAGLENSCPPLAVISSRIKSHTLLASFVNPGVEVVKYAYESTSLQRLFQMMEATLKGRKALCIAFIAHGQPGSLKLCTQKVKRYRYNVSFFFVFYVSFSLLARIALGDSIAPSGVVSYRFPPFLTGRK